MPNKPALHLVKNQPVLLLGAAFGWGGRRHGAEDGPLWLQQHFGHFGQHFVLNGQAFCFDAVIHPQVSHHNHMAENGELTREETFPLVLDFNRRLCSHVRQLVRHQKKFAVIGGDHAVAMGTWSAVAAELPTNKTLGLLWIDAHMDAHTPQTAHQGGWGGFYHGRPVAVLLGYGEQELCCLGAPQPKLLPEHLLMVGIRSYEEGEDALLKRLGVKVYFMHDVAKNGAAATITQAVAYLNQTCDYFGVSIDLDAFDPVYAPAVATREAHGLLPAQVLPALHGVGHMKKCCGLEIVEFNPERDENNKTTTLIADLLTTFYGNNT